MFSAFGCALRSYVVGGCNVVAILSMADMVCRDCMQNCGVHEQCWVCMLCWNLSCVVKFYCC